LERTFFLRELAQTGYNIGYAAKKHLATYDIVEKAPGGISLVILAFGIFALVIPALENHIFAAALLSVGIAAFYFNSYQDQRARYETVGSRLTALFTDLRRLYYETQSCKDGDNLAELEVRYKEILAESQTIGISKQIFLSDWYAHYKFFWQAQTDWLDEQLHFKFWRDKIPLSLSATVVMVIILIAALVVFMQVHVCTAMGGAT
jgi:hypothetical protein